MLVPVRSPRIPPQRHLSESVVYAPKLTQLRHPRAQTLTSEALPDVWLRIGRQVSIREQRRRRALRCGAMALPSASGAAMALQRGGLSAFAACRAMRATGPAHALHLLPAAGLLAPAHAAQERRPLRSWLWAALAPVALSASRAARVSGVRSLHVSCCTDGNLPATFVAPTKVNMADFPPPKRRLSKGASSPEQRRSSAPVSFLGVLFCSCVHACRRARRTRRRRHRAVRAQRRRGRAEREQGRVAAPTQRSVRRSRSRCATCAVNTKADIRFDVLGADWLPDWVKENLLEQARAGLRCSVRRLPVALLTRGDRLERLRRRRTA